MAIDGLLTSEIFALIFIMIIAVIIVVFFVFVYFYFIRPEGSGLNALWAGKIGINIEKKSFKPGEIINGRITLELKKPVHGKMLKMALIGKMWVYDRQGNNKYYPLYKEEVNIADENDFYNNQTYPFKLKIPENVLEIIDNWGEDGMGFIGDKQFYIGDRMKSMQKKAKQMAESLNLVQDSRDYWYIQAEIELPRKLNILSKSEIFISRDHT